jgi:hypothetical protein
VIDGAPGGGGVHTLGNVSTLKFANLCKSFVGLFLQQFAGLFFESMKFSYAALIIAISCLSGCSAPDKTAAETALRQEIESQSNGNIKLISFSKTDGQSMDVGGLQMRQINYTAQIEFAQNGTWLSGGWPGKLVYNFTTKISTSQSVSTRLLESMDLPVRVSEGGHAQIKGTMTGTKKDNGWQFETSESSLVSPIAPN